MALEIRVDYKTSVLAVLLCSFLPQEKVGEFSGFDRVFLLTVLQVLVGWHTWVAAAPRWPPTSRATSRGAEMGPWPPSWAVVANTGLPTVRGISCDVQEFRHEPRAGGKIYLYCF